MSDERPVRATIGTIAREWTRLGVTGFGGPPAHIALLRRLMERNGWMDTREFEDANAACGLLPGPASTQLAIFCAYRVAGAPGAIVGGLGFVVPAVLFVLGLSFCFSPTRRRSGSGARVPARAAVAAVAVDAARGLLGPSFQRARAERSRTMPWATYLLAGVLAAVLLGPYLVLVLLGCGLIELVRRHVPHAVSSVQLGPLTALAPAVVSGGFAALGWTAFKVGALGFGGGFVIIPLMQGDAVHTYHWMTNSQFLNAVALGQVTPGPVVATIAAVGYAAHGLAGGGLAAAVAFAPSFSFILLGGDRFERIRQNARARAFLDGAGPAAIGAILGAGITLAGALHEGWQFAILAAAAIALLVLHRGIVATLLAAGAIGVIAALLGAPLP
jgi:chromate transporter